MDYTLLKDVNNKTQHWTVKVRVVRFCDFIPPKEPRKRTRINMILLDEQNKTMEGQVPENWLQRFKGQLEEDHIYYIKYFLVLNAKPVFRHTDHEYMMRFTLRTRIYEVKAVLENFPLYAHSVVPYDVLRSRVGNNKYTSDVIGILTGCSQSRLQVTRHGSRQLRNINITDGRETAVVALWGTHATSFNAEQYIKQSYNEPVVLLFCSVECQVFKGSLSLQGTPVCRWYANPDIPEAIALKKSYINRMTPGNMAEPGMMCTRKYIQKTITLFFSKTKEQGPTAVAQKPSTPATSRITSEQNGSTTLETSDDILQTATELPDQKWQAHAKDHEHTEIQKSQSQRSVRRKLTTDELSLHE